MSSFRDTHELADQVVNSIKRLLSRCGRRKNLLADLCGKPSPSTPIETRWGTWLKYCTFINENYDRLKDFSKLIGHESKTASQLQVHLESEDVKQQFVSIHAYQSLIFSITSLEKRGLTILEQKSVIDNALAWLPQLYEDKLLDCLRKNPDYANLLKLPQADMLIPLYSPLVSVDVERSFSQFKNILTDRRLRMTGENFSKYAFVYFNTNIEYLNKFELSHSIL